MQRMTLCCAVALELVQKIAFSSSSHPQDKDDALAGEVVVLHDAPRPREKIGKGSEN